MGIFRWDITLLKENRGVLLWGRHVKGEQKGRCCGDVTSLKGNKGICRGDVKLKGRVCTVFEGL